MYPSYTALYSDIKIRTLQTVIISLQVQPTKDLKLLYYLYLVTYALKGTKIENQATKKERKKKEEKKKKNSITENIHHYTFEYLPCITRLNLVSIVTNTNKDCPSKSAVPQVKILR